MSYFWFFVKWIKEYKVKVDFLPNFTCIQNICASIDSHGVWIESKVLIMIELYKANEALILLQLQNVLYWVFKVLLIHND